MSYVGVDNDALHRLARFIVLLMFLILIIYLLTWMTYGRLRYFALPQARKEARTVSIILAVLSGVGLILAAIWAVAALRSTSSAGSAGAHISLAVCVLALVVVCVMSIMSAVVVERNWKKARTYTLVSALTSGAVLLLAYLGLFVASYRLEMAHVKVDGTTTL